MYMIQVKQHIYLLNYLLIYVFTFLIGWCLTLIRLFHLLTTASIMVLGNRSEPGGNPRPSADCFQFFLRMTMEELGINLNLV